MHIIMYIFMHMQTSHKLSLSLSHTHTHKVSLSLSLSLSHTHTHTQSLSLSHTHTFSLSHTHTNSLSRIHTHKTQQRALTCIVYKLVRLLSVQCQGFDVPPMVLQDRVLKYLTGELELQLLDHLLGRFNLLLRRCGGQHGSECQESQLQAN